MAFPLIMFDFDGTLADSLPRFLIYMNQIAAEYGFRQIRDDELETVRDFNTRQFLKHLQIPYWRLPQIVRRMRTMLSDENSSVPLFAGIEELLRDLNSCGCQLGLVSSNSQKNIERILGPELWGLFQWRQCEASLFGKRSKLRKVLKQAGRDPSEALYIGDEVRDLDAAHAEGIAFGGVTWGHARREQFANQQPRFIWDAVEEMRQSLIEQV